jgi:S-adenosylmethionine decarboxylase
VTLSIGEAPRGLAPDAARPATGIEWMVEAAGCDPDRLRDRDTLVALFDEIVRDLALHPVAPAAWHQFPGPGGITGIVMLAESHLTVHTFPEYGSLCLNLFCCRPRAEWPFDRMLRLRLGARECRVRHAERPYGPLLDARP